MSLAFLNYPNEYPVFEHLTLFDKVKLRQVNKEFRDSLSLIRNIASRHLNLKFEFAETFADQIPKVLPLKFQAEKLTSQMSRTLVIDPYDLFSNETISLKNPIPCYTKTEPGRPEAFETLIYHAHHNILKKEEIKTDWTVEETDYRDALSDLGYSNPALNTFFENEITLQCFQIPALDFACFLNHASSIFIQLAPDHLPFKITGDLPEKSIQYLGAFSPDRLLTLDASGNINILDKVQGKGIPLSAYKAQNLYPGKEFASVTAFFHEDLPHFLLLSEKGEVFHLFLNEDQVNLIELPLKSILQVAQIQKQMLGFLDAKGHVHTHPTTSVSFERFGQIKPKTVGGAILKLYDNPLSNKLFLCEFKHGIPRFANDILKRIFPARLADLFSGVKV